MYRIGDLANGGMGYSEIPCMKCSRCASEWKYKEGKDHALSIEQMPTDSYCMIHSSPCLSVCYVSSIHRPSWIPTTYLQSEERNR